MCNVDMVDTVSWYAQESVRLSVEPWRCGKRVEIPQGATAAWVVADESGTNWIVRYDAAPGTNRCAFALGAGEGALPEGHDYTGYVSLLRGTNILGVIDRHEVRVMGQAADGGGELSPEGGAWGSLLARMAEAEADIHGIAGDLATNALEIANLEDATNHLAGAVSALETAVGAVDGRIDGLWAECAGGWRWPDYFTVAGVEAGVPPGAVTNAALSTQTVHNVVVETVESAVIKGWRIYTEVVRQSDWSEGVRWEVLEGGIAPEDLEVDGDVVHFAEGVESVGGDFAAVRGTLGNCTVALELDFDPAKQSAASTVHRFAGPAAGSLLEASWATVLGAASNGFAQGKGVNLRTWPEGHGDGTAGVAAGWNPNFWGAGLGDFSCVSYHTDTPGGGVYKPLAMVTDRHAVCANHWKPAVGSNVYWVSRSGAILTNRVVAYQNIRGDLTVARLEHPFATNDILPATLLAPGFWHCTYGTTNATHGMPGFPCISFDCAERGYLSGWEPLSLAQGRTGKDLSQDGYSVDGLLSYTGEPWTAPYVRAQAIGGDSGSPTFWPAPGCTVLLGCFHVATGGPMPRKDEIDEAIEAWGDAERCTEWDPYSDGRWANPDVPPGM